MPSEPTPTCNFCRGSAKVCPDWCRGAWHPSVVGGAAPSAPTTPAQRAALHALTEQAQALGLGYDRPSAPTTDAPTDKDANELELYAHRWENYRDLPGGFPDRVRAIARRLRGGATAPTPDPTDDLRDAVRDLLTGLAHPEHLTGCGTVYQTTIPAHVVDRLRRWLRRDTGGTHE